MARIAFAAGVLLTVAAVASIARGEDAASPGATGLPAPLPAFGFPTLLNGDVAAAVGGFVRGLRKPVLVEGLIAQLAVRLERRPVFVAQTNDAMQAFLDAMARRGTPRPTLVEDGVALVDEANTGLDQRFNILRSMFVFPKGASQEKTVRSGDSRVAALLNQWFAEGTAAGNFGDLYDNRDRAHSSFPADAFPQMARTRYGDLAKAAGIDFGRAVPLIFNVVTLGNASLAATGGPNWRSLPREALTAPGGAVALFLQYASNQIYVYPEHEDHDAKLGDLLTANTPYYIISQGSSFSDQPFLHTIASILAAFRPEVKTFLTEQGLIAPTVQWILRRSLHGIDSDDDYLSGKAHPSVFQKESLDVMAMITRAHELKRDEVPAMVRLQVIKESQGEPGVDFFVPGGEVLFDTPSAIARVIRSTDYEKRLVIDTAYTINPTDRPLSFRWVVLGGDDRVTITPLDQSGSIAEIIVPWQERRTLTEWPIIPSDRVDIGVFAYNGKNWSAPAFISLLYPGNERRTYRSDRQIAEVDYNASEFRDRYVDPIVFPLMQWRDTYRYNGENHLIGWDRIRGQSRSRFTRNGARVVDEDEIGRPVKAEIVRYEIHPTNDGRPEIVEVPTGEFVTYSYESDDDLLGKPAAPPRGTAHPVVRIRFEPAIH